VHTFPANVETANYKAEAMQVWAPSKNTMLPINSPSVKCGTPANNTSRALKTKNNDR